jgi:hypothetical protein
MRQRRADAVVGRTSLGGGAIATAIAVLVALVCFRAVVAGTSGHLAWSDGYCYFLYARSVVIDHDTDISNEYAELDRRYPEGRGDSVLDAVRTNAQRHPKTGGIFTPFPPGEGLLLAPAYWAGWQVEQLVAARAGRAADTYGLIPQYAFALGSLAFAILGFWATAILCAHVAPRAEALLATAGAVFAGPLLFYVYFSPTMAHAVTFGLFATYTLVWWRQWERGATVKGLMLIGFLVGVLATIRIQNLLFGVLAFALVAREVSASLGRAAKLALAGALGALPPLAVLFVHTRLYVYSSGGLRWLENGALQIGQYPIDLRSPFFLDVLFSCQHGAFHWSPLLAVGAAGLILALPRHAWAWLLLGVLAIQVYLIGGLGHSLPSGYEVARWSIKDYAGYKEQLSQHGATTWENLWWGGPMFGMRYLSDSAHVFAVGLAFAFGRFGGVLRTAFRPAAIGLVALLVGWNLLLIGAYGMNTVSRTGCATYAQMADGIGQAVTRVAGKLLR